MSTGNNRSLQKKINTIRSTFGIAESEYLNQRAASAATSTFRRFPKPAVPDFPKSGSTSLKSKRTPAIVSKKPLSVIGGIRKSARVPPSKRALQDALNAKAIANRLAVKSAANKALRAKSARIISTRSESARDTKEAERVKSVREKANAKEAARVKSAGKKANAKEAARVKSAGKKANAKEAARVKVKAADNKKAATNEAERVKAADNKKAAANEAERVKAADNKKAAANKAERVKVKAADNKKAAANKAERVKVKAANNKKAAANEAERVKVKAVNNKKAAANEAERVKVKAVNNKKAAANEAAKVKSMKVTSKKAGNTNAIKLQMSSVIMGAGLKDINERGLNQYYTSLPTLNSNVRNGLLKKITDIKMVDSIEKPGDLGKLAKKLKLTGFNNVKRDDMDEFKMRLKQQIINPPTLKREAETKTNVIETVKRSKKNEKATAVQERKNERAEMKSVKDAAAANYRASQLVKKAEKAAVALERSGVVNMQGGSWNAQLYNLFITKISAEPRRRVDKNREAVIAQIGRFNVQKSDKIIKNKNTQITIETYLDVLLIIWLDGIHDGYVNIGFLAWYDAQLKAKVLTGVKAREIKAMIGSNSFNMKSRLGGLLEFLQTNNVGLYENIMSSLNKELATFSAGWERNVKNFLINLYSKDKEHYVRRSFVNRISSTGNDNKILLAVDQEFSKSQENPLTRLIDGDEVVGLITFGQALDPGSTMLPKLITTELQSLMKTVSNDNSFNRFRSNSKYALFGYTHELKIDGESVFKVDISNPDTPLPDLTFNGVKMTLTQTAGGAGKSNSNNHAGKISKYFGDALQYLIFTHLSKNPVVSAKEKKRHMFWGSGDSMALLGYKIFCDIEKVKPNMIIDGSLSSFPGIHIINAPPGLTYASKNSVNLSDAVTLQNNNNSNNNNSVQSRRTSAPKPNTKRV
jgi:hypothetical protein